MFWSLRGRLTALAALSGAGVLLALTVILLSAERTAEERELRRRVDELATIADRLIAQGGVQRFSGVLVTADSARPQALSAATGRLLAAIPGYLIVADAARPLYISPTVADLGTRDRETLVQAVTGLFEPDRQAAFVQLEAARLYVRVRFTADTIAGVPLRIAVGMPSDGLSLVRLDGFASSLVAIPLLILGSAVIAFSVLGTGLRPLERLARQLEAIQHGRSLHRRVAIEGDAEEVDRLAETINAMLERLETSFASLRRFTADASHELKTPLTVLRATLERAMQQPNVPAEQLAALEDALANTARMADLVDSLLTLARADEGRFDLHREPVAMEPLVVEMLETATILGEAAGIAVRRLDIEPVTVLGDPDRLRQLLLNIVTNAIKYTPRGGTVSIGLERRGEQAAVTIDDTGVGIASVDVPFIFERFWRADRARSRGERGGLGLGLSIAEWIAQAHGGTITVASRIGRGTTFTVQLPLLRDGESAAS
ncbi:MAG: HAMP domain-containing protein [Gemmatimonadetes bacterium]|nr:HAMP domain-containing protein [Gemmatimonadota bacterium]